MSDNIINFPTPAPTNQIVLICRECGCSTFYIDSNFNVECANCSEIADPESVEWKEAVPLVPPNPPSNEGSFSVINHQDDFTANRSIKKLENWRSEKTLQFVAGLCQDGNFTSWSNARNSEQQQEIIRKLYILIERLQKAGFSNEHSD